MNPAVSIHKPLSVQCTSYKRFEEVMNASPISSPQSNSSPDQIEYQPPLVNVVTDLDLISYFLSDSQNQMDQITAESMSTNKLGEQHVRHSSLNEGLNKTSPSHHSVSSLSTVGKEDALLPLPRKKSLAPRYKKSSSGKNDDNFASALVGIDSESCFDSQRRLISATDTTSSVTTLTSTKSQGVTQSLHDSVKRPKRSLADNQDTDPDLQSDSEKKRQRINDSASCESRSPKEERTATNAVNSKEVQEAPSTSLRANLSSPLVVPPLVTKAEPFLHDSAGNEAVSTHALLREGLLTSRMSKTDVKGNEDLILAPVPTADIISFDIPPSRDPRVNIHDRDRHCHGASVTNMKVGKEELATNEKISTNQKDFQGSCTETTALIPRSPFLTTDHSHREPKRWDQNMQICPERTTATADGPRASKPFDQDYGSATARHHTFQPAATFHCNVQDSHQEPNTKDEAGNPARHYSSSPMTSSIRDCHKDQSFDSWQVFMEQKDKDEEARERCNSWPPQGIPTEKPSSFHDDSVLHQAYCCDGSTTSNMFSQEHHYQENQGHFYDSKRGSSNTRRRGEIQDYGHHGRSNETSSNSYHMEHRQYEQPPQTYDFGMEGLNQNEHFHPRREHSNSWPSCYPPVPPLNEAQYLAEIGEDFFSSAPSMSKTIKSASARKGTKKNRANVNHFKTDYAHGGGRRPFVEGKVPRIASSSYDAPPIYNHGDDQRQNGYTPGFSQYCHPARQSAAEDMQHKPTGTSSSRGYYNPSSDQFPLQPYYNREIIKLSTSEDESWLSEFLCFVRSQCVEVFSATKEDVASRMNSKKVLLNQVGIRCRFCAHIPHRERSGRSSSFPSSISRIYQSLTMMLRDHFTKCHAMPQQMKERYLCLKANASQGATDSKKYWVESAHTLGLIDTEEGIRFASPLSTMD